MIERCLAFTDQQLDMLLTAVEHVPAQWRSRFLNDVAHQLMPAPELPDEQCEVVRLNTIGDYDADVHEAITNTLRKITPQVPP
jgi:hypothetical protein